MRSLSRRRAAGEGAHCFTYVCGIEHMHLSEYRAPISVGPLALSGRVAATTTSPAKSRTSDVKRRGSENSEAWRVPSLLEMFGAAARWAAPGIVAFRKEN